MVQMMNEAHIRNNKRIALAKGNFKEVERLNKILRFNNLRTRIDVL